MSLGEEVGVSIWRLPTLAFCLILSCVIVLHDVDVDVNI